MKSLLFKLLTRLFRVEEINGADRCPTYLYRWTLARVRGCGLYLHRFVGDDWSLDCHDHPKRFVSFMLWGRYRETERVKAERSRSGHDEFHTREFAAPWLRSFPSTHTHRLTVRPGEECWTLVLVLPASRPWGFWHLGMFVPWREYVFGKFSHLADRRAVCRGIEDRRQA